MRLLKDGESIGNDDRRLGVIFAFDTISGRCNDFVYLISSDFADDISWFFSVNINSKAKILSNRSDAISIQLSTPYNTGSFCLPFCFSCLLSATRHFAIYFHVFDRSRSVVCVQIVNSIQTAARIAIAESCLRPLPRGLEWRRII
jgi:hypothetical protein